MNAERPTVEPTVQTGIPEAVSDLDLMFEFGDPRGENGGGGR
jgi:hypothetical protein